MDSNALERARKIRLMLFDVDGVLTDGTIWVVPSASPRLTEGQAREAEAKGGGFSISSDRMAEAKGFSAHDGLGISLARLAGLQCGILTRRISEAVAVRARDLRLDYVYQGQQYKIQAFREIISRSGFSAEQIAYAGDDVIDLPVMRACGLAIAPANAREQVKAEAHYITPSRGGFGAGRDAIEFILAAKGVLEDATEKYLDQNHEPPAAGEGLSR